MAGSRYVQVTMTEIEAFLRGKTPHLKKGLCGREVVLFVRHPKCEDVRVEVFTSVGVGEEAARPCGWDAIKVCCVYDDGYHKRFGLMRESIRILRVGTVEAVLSRVYAAVVQCHAQAGLWLKAAVRQDPTLQPGWTSDCPSHGTPLLDV